MTASATLPRAILVAAVSLASLVVGPGCAWRGGGNGAASTGGTTVRREPTAAEKQQAIRSYIRGVQAQKSGNRAAAKTAFASATQANPDLVMARSMLGDLLREERQFEQAARQYEALTQLDPYTANNFYRLGVSYHLLQRLQQAATAYLKAIDLQPRDWKSNMNLGLVYMALGQHSDALQYSRKAVELNGNSAVAWANLGVALEAAGQLDQAANAYRRSIELDPTRLATYMNLTSSLLAQKKGAEAAQVMETVVRRQDTAVTRRRYGEALTAAGRYEDSINQFSLALRKDPRYFPALNGLGDAQLRQYLKSLRLDESKRDEALATWQRSLQINPNQPSVQAMLQKWARR